MAKIGKLTQSQKESWSIDGYILLKGVLPKRDRERILIEVDRFYRKRVRNPDADSRGIMDYRNILAENDVFLDLIDHPATFGMVVELMGPYIQLSMAEAMVRSPNPDYEGFIHTDGGQAMRRIRVTETSLPIQLKIQYFLTDVVKPNYGNFTLFPGSHLRPFPEGEDPVSAETPGAVQICAKAGDAAVFSHSLWHGVSPNFSKRSRKTLIYCYSQMCFRTFDFNGHTPEVVS